MSYLSRREIEDLKPSIDKAVYKVLGSSDSSLVSTAVHCLNSGYDKRKTTDKLSSYVDSKKAARVADKIFDIIEDYQSSHRSKKRSHDESRDRDSKRSKSRHDERDNRYDSDRNDRKSKSNEVMESAQKQIQERKRALDKNLNLSNLNIPQPSIYGIPMGLLNRGDADKARKIAQLQAQIKSKLSSGILANAIQIPVVPNKPTPLILDDEGRTVDKTGKAVQLTHVVPTLKANIRAQKREQFRSQLSDKVDDSNETKFYDGRIGIKPPMRNKRMLRFHEPGKFLQQAERLRMKVGLNLFRFVCMLSLTLLGATRKTAK